MIRLVLFATLFLGICALPEFSWDTPPVFVHMCQRSGPFSKSQVEYLARYPIVTIEKGQGIDTGKPAEYEIEEAAAQVKSVNPKAYVIFYYNLVLDWAFYEAHQIMEKNPSWWLRDKENNVVYLHGDVTFPNHTNILVFDFSQKVVRDFWASIIVNATKTGNIDGAFGDRGCMDGIPFDRLTTEKANGYKTGFLETITQTQQQIGSNRLFIDNCLGKPCATGQCPIQGVNAMQMENFCKDLIGLRGKLATGCIADIEKLQSFNDRSDLIIEVHYYRNHLKNDTNIELPLAAFLIAASENTYFGFSKGWYLPNDWDIWWPEYSKKLGEPSGLATRKANVFTRSFQYADVTLDVETQTANIAWTQ